MPNLLAAKPVVEEFIQSQVTPENLSAALMRLIDNPERVAELKAIFGEIYLKLKRNASEQAAVAVLEMCDTKMESYHVG